MEGRKGEGRLKGLLLFKAIVFIICLFCIIVYYIYVNYHELILCIINLIAVIL
jgi:hypothetical protein